MTFSGLVTALALAAVLLAGTSNSSRVQAAEDHAECPIVQIASDEGYGVSGTVARRICR